MEFDVPTSQDGDNYARFWVRIQEIRQSMRIIRQCVEQIEPGPVRAQVPLVLRPEPGAEAYGRVEASKGELAFYLISDGGISPLPLQDTLAVPAEPDGDRAPAGGLEAGRHDCYARQH